MFQKAVKRNSKGRVALIGPAGSGKSYTALILARALAGDDGKIAAIDTEHGSLSKYADLFDFDVHELDSFSPDNFLKALAEAEKAGYSVFLCDSLSHFWMGKDGALEFVDTAKKRSTSRDDMAGWKDFGPIERRMVDTMIASKCHVIVTMRTKTEYQEEEYTNSRGERKKKRVKIGLAPVQRQGLEYEFDIVGSMDEDNNVVIDKTRCPFYAKKAISSPGAKEFAPFIEWLKGAEVEAPKSPVVNEDDPLAPLLKLFDAAASKFDRLKLFGEVKARLETATGAHDHYYGVLKTFKVEKSDQFRTLKDARACYIKLLEDAALAEMPKETVNA